MTVTDRTDATEQEFAARIAPFDIFAEERVIEEVARAIRRQWVRQFDRYCDDWDEAEPDVHDHYRRLAVAAVAAYRATQGGGAEEAVRRGLALADELDDAAADYRHVPSGTHDAGARNAHMAIARRIRAALTAESR